MSEIREVISELMLPAQLALLTSDNLGKYKFSLKLLSKMYHVKQILMLFMLFDAIYVICCYFTIYFVVTFRLIM